MKPKILSVLKGIKSLSIYFLQRQKNMKTKWNENSWRAWLKMQEIASNQSPNHFNQYCLEYLKNVSAFWREGASGKMNRADFFKMERALNCAIAKFCSTTGISKKWEQALSVQAMKAISQTQNSSYQNNCLKYLLLWMKNGLWGELSEFQSSIRYMLRFTDVHRIRCTEYLGREC